MAIRVTTITCYVVVEGQLVEEVMVDYPTPPPSSVAINNKKSQSMPVTDELDINVFPISRPEKSESEVRDVNADCRRVTLQPNVGPSCLLPC